MSHSTRPTSFNVLTKVLAASKESVGPFSGGVYPSQSGIETHPALRYALAGSLGMLEGRLPLALYSFHSFHPAPSFSARTNVLAASKGSGSNALPQSLSSLQPPTFAPSPPPVPPTTFAAETRNAPPAAIDEEKEEEEAEEEDEEDDDEDGDEEEESTTETNRPPSQSRTWMFSCQVPGDESFSRMQM